MASNKTLILLTIEVVYCCFARLVVAEYFHENFSEFMKTLGADPNDPEAYVAKVDGYKWKRLERDGQKYTGLYFRNTPEYRRMAEDFGRLKKLEMKGYQCNDDAHDILSTCDRVTETRTRNRPELMGPLLPSERVLYQVALKHAEGCRSKYPARFTEVFKKLDPVMLNMIQTVWGEFLQRDYGSRKLGFGVKELARFVSTIENTTDGMFEDGKLFFDTVMWLLNAIKGLAADDRDRIFLEKVYNFELEKRAVDSQKALKFLNKYLYTPCKHYASTMSKRVFKPLEYDLVIHSLPLTDYIREDDDDNEENIDKFWLGWAYHKYCDALLQEGGYSSEFLVHGPDGTPLQRQWIDAVTASAR